jgi:hypothetical protein
MRNLSVPDINLADPVGGNISGMKEEPLASVSISTNTKQIGSARPQYIPSDAKQRQIAIARGEIVPEKVNRIRNKVHKIKGADYMNADDTHTRNGTVESEILSLAKELWKEDASARKIYKKARQIVSDADDSELDDPGPRLKKALMILDKGIMTKKKAKAAAREKLRTKDYA